MNTIPLCEFHCTSSPLKNKKCADRSQRTKNANSVVAKQTLLKRDRNPVFTKWNLLFYQIQKSKDEKGIVIPIENYPS